MQTTDMTVANTIVQQIGNRAFVMMGTVHKVGDHNSLLFDFKGCPKFNKCRVTLTPMDTYTLTFYKLGPRPLFEVKKEKKVEGVYADQLHTIIQRETGLSLSF